MKMKIAFLGLVCAFLFGCATLWEAASDACNYALGGSKAGDQCSYLEEKAEEARSEEESEAEVEVEAEASVE